VSGPAPRPRPCPAGFARARLAKAAGFMEAAEIADQLDDDHKLRDAVVTLLIHSGVASSDVICCERLGEHRVGDDHSAAATLLERVDKGLAEQLRRLRSMKTSAAYSSAPSGADDLNTARRAAQKLLEATQQQART
jgi:hypothetical protein